MTWVMVNPNICGFVTTIEVEKAAKRKVKVVITSDCEMVIKRSESLAEVVACEALRVKKNSRERG